MNHKKQQQANRMNMAPGNMINRPQYPPFQSPTPQPQPQPHYNMGVHARPMMPNQHMMAAQQAPGSFGMQMHPQMQPQAMGGPMGGPMGGAMGGGQQYPSGGGMMRYPGMMAPQMGGMRPVGQMVGQSMMQPFPPRPAMYEEAQSVTTIPNPSFSRPPGSGVTQYLPASGSAPNLQGKPGLASSYSTVSMSPGPPIAQGSPSSLVSHTHVPLPQSGVTSPAPATPILPPSPAAAVNSPAQQPSMTPEENEAYLRKFNDLQGYIPLLERMLSRVIRQTTDDRRNEQYQKLKSLHSLLQDNLKRVPLQTLFKCEQALKKMFEQQQLPTTDGTGGILPPAAMTSTSVAPPIPPVSLPQQQAKSQSFLELKMVSSPSPTFASLADTIQLNPFPVERLPLSKRQGSKGQRSLSPGLKREIASLEAFNFKLVSMGETEQDVILQCSLADTCLPSVPPLKVRIPVRYPKASVEWTNVDEYEKTPFCKLISSLVVDKVSKLPSCASLSSLLTTWESCVLKATTCELAT